MDALRRIGASVFSLHKVGQGCPDLLVGYRGRNWLIEIKNPDQVKSKRRLTPDEKEFHDSWRGQVAIVETVDEALAVLGNHFTKKGTVRKRFKKQPDDDEIVAYDDAGIPISRMEAAFL